MPRALPVAHAMVATANPAFADGAQEGHGVDIEAGLEDGTLTAEQAVVLQERQMERMRVEMQAQMEAKTAQMIAAAQLGVAGSDNSESTVTSMVRGVVARLTEAPTNFHQATVYFLMTDAPQDEAMARRAPLLYAGSLAMVMLQSVTAIGVAVGTIIPSCATSDQCGTGTFCEVGGRDRCVFCGGDVPLPLETEGTCTFLDPRVTRTFTAADAGCTSRNNAEDLNHVGFNLTRVLQVCTMPYIGRDGLDGLGNRVFFPNTSVAAWCESCVRNDGTVDPMGATSLIAGNLTTMGTFDDAALVFAAFIVAFTVVGELKDIQLCSIAIAHADDKLSKGWRIALSFLLGIRRWVFLPSLVATVPNLVLLKGGDALSVCLNTVAILFLCDIDNIVFDLALGERVRARVEGAGRVELGSAEAAALTRTKAVHVALIVLAVLAGLWPSHQVLSTHPRSSLSCSAAWWSHSPGRARRKRPSAWVR